MEIHRGHLETEPKCANCGKGANSYTGGKAAPAPGDFSVCVYCGALLRYDGEPLTLRAITDAELVMLMTSPAWPMVKRMQNARERVRQALEGDDATGA